MTVGDKIRPWRLERCRHPDCEFEAKAEFEWLRHMDENPGHVVAPATLPVTPQCGDTTTGWRSHGERR